MAMEPLSFLWLSSQPRRGQVTMYSFRLICTLTSHAAPVIHSGLWTYLRRSLVYKPSMDGLNIDFELVEQLEFDAENGEQLADRPRANFTFQVEPRTGKFVRVVALDVAVDMLLQAEKGDAAVAASEQVRAQTAKRIESEARDIWMSLAEAWLPATAPFMTDKQDPSTLTTERVKENGKDAVAVHLKIIGDADALRERIGWSLNTPGDRPESRISTTEIEWTQSLDGTVVRSTMEPLLSTRSDTLRIEYSHGGIPCFYLRASMKRDVIRCSDGSSPAHLPEDELWAALGQYYDECASRYQQLVADYPAAAETTDKALKDAFDGVDADASGSIDVTELARVLRQLGLQGATNARNIATISFRADAKRVFEVLDKDNNGSVSWQEFRSFFAATEHTPEERRLLSAMSLGVLAGLRLEGYVHKLGGNIKKWTNRLVPNVQLRYLVLDKQKRALLYFASAEAAAVPGAAPRGIIDLAQCDAATPESPFRIKGAAFSVHARGKDDRVYVFSCASEKERDRWVDAINRARANEPNSGADSTPESGQDSAAAVVERAVESAMVGIAPRRTRVTGTAVVTVIGASNLAAKDRHSAKSDPYCVVYVDGERAAKTKVIKATLDPVWNQDFEIELVQASVVEFRVMDWDRIGKNDLCGSTAFFASHLLDGLSHSFSLPLSPIGSLRITAALRLTSPSSSSSSTSLPTAIFGRPFADIDASRVTQRLTETVESRGLGEVGLYRVSGSQAGIQSIRAAFNQKGVDHVDLNAVGDVNEVTCVLKLFYREAPEPAIPVDMREAFIRGGNGIEGDIEGAARVFGMLPSEIGGALRILFAHLHKVGLNANENKMSYTNLSTVFSPTLFQTVDMSGAGQNRALELYLKHWPQIAALL